MTDGPKILTVDIETSPMQSWHFGTRNINITLPQIKEPSRMICWAAKWLGEKKVLFRSEYHDGQWQMLEHLWHLLDEADVVVGYNSDKFDLRKIRREFRLMNQQRVAVGMPSLGDPSPPVSVDLYKVIKKAEDWDSHKLAWITEQLELSGKLDNSGWPLWVACVDPDIDDDTKRKAWALMRRYNKRDVVTTEELFIEYRPLCNIPNLALWGDAPVLTEDGRPPCPSCKSHHVTRQGYKRTKVRRYPQYKCEDCGRWYSESKSDMGVSAT